MRKPTPEEVNARRSELLRILAKEEPDGKNWYSGKRKDWRRQQARAKEDLQILDSGRWRIADIPW